MLLLDTTVYIDSARRAGLPDAIAALIADHPIRHGSLCVGELGFGYGRLDPGHPATPRNQTAILDLLRAIQADTVIHPSSAGWARAGTLVGAVARMQGFALNRRRALFNDTGCSSPRRKPA